MCRTAAVVSHPASVGSSANAASLAYGDALAQAGWAQRLRTLHTGATMKSYDRLLAQPKGG